jgi:hypothetical protein
MILIPENIYKAMENELFDMQSLHRFQRQKRKYAAVKNKKTIVLELFFCCLIVLIAGCSSSQLVDIRSNVTYQSQPLNKILVVSVGKKSMVRHIWEDAFSAELAKHHVAAVPSYRMFADTVPDTNQVLQIVRSNKFDGILVYRRLPSEMKTSYRQGFGMSEDNMVYDRFTERFVVSYFLDTEYAAHTDSQKIDIRIIDVWTTKNEGQLIWSAVSKIPEPNSMQDIQPEIIGHVLSDLTSRNIIAFER